MENRGVDGNIHTPVFTRTGFWSCWMFTLYYSLHLYCLHEKRRRFHHVGITEARVGGVGGSGTPAPPGTHGTWRFLALARGQPGVGTHRDGHRPGERGRHSLAHCPGAGVRPTHFIYGFLRPCGACRSPSRISASSRRPWSLRRACAGRRAASRFRPTCHEITNEERRTNEARPPPWFGSTTPYGRGGGYLTVIDDTSRVHTVRSPYRT